MNDHVSYVMVISFKIVEFFVDPVRYSDTVSSIQNNGEKIAWFGKLFFFQYNHVMMHIQTINALWKFNLFVVNNFKLVVTRFFKIESMFGTFNYLQIVRMIQYKIIRKTLVKFIQRKTNFR